MRISPANSCIICRQEPHGIAPSIVTTAKDLNLLYPWANAEKIATLSAQRVVGYALDSILNPLIILLSSVSIAAPTG